jgi:hypothetical protein
MGGEEEKKIELVIREQVTKVVDEVVEVAKVEEVTKEVEKVAEAVGVSAITPVVSEVKAAATTAVASGIKELTQLMGLSMISESSLSDDQKKLAAQIYEYSKEAVKSFIDDSSLNNTVKITKTLGQVIKQLENVKIDGKAPSGADKKAVAIQLGRILIKEVTPDDKGETEILMVYDLVAEPTLEAMIEVSRVVNVAVHEMATKCCPGLLEFFKRAKKTA